MCKSERESTIPTTSLTNSESYQTSNNLQPITKYTEERENSAKEKEE